MPRPLLSPRWVFVPTWIIYNHHLSAPAILTWIQLRGLAWGRTATSALSMQELADLTGKSQATLYRHMSQLRAIAALRWRATRQGRIIVSFADEPSESINHSPGSPGNPLSKMTETKNSILTPPCSYFPAQILGYLSIQDDDEELSKDNQSTLFTKVWF